ncbi:MAG: uridine kinase family protein [Elusimicrobiota bacterium]
MLGDKIVVKEHHKRAAGQVYDKISEEVLEKDGPVAITVAGESGSGKSEIGSEIARLFEKKNGLNSIIFAQDDYFKLPPKSNDAARRDNIDRVGMGEVKLDLLDEHIENIKSGRKLKFNKPLIDYENDDILTEKVDGNGIDIIVAEGTYTTELHNADYQVFIDRTYEDTYEHRKERGRDELDEYMDKILRIEHDIISSQKNKADIVINKDYRVSG